ncbi:MAG TPA: hypothetical protein VMA73_31550 [Streptosporangiaceae bacterium]|nr:hypothetical protein [Streptosporangiaceae bacterium]
MGDWWFSRPAVVGVIAGLGDHVIHHAISPDISGYPTCPDRYTLAGFTT